MRCPECGEASNSRLRYCENCGAKMPEAPQGGTGSRPALRPKRAMDEPSYAADILDEAEAHSLGAAYVPAAAKAAAPADTAEDTDPGQTGPRFDGPRWLASVPAHSQSVVGLAILAFALALSILPAFDGVGVVGTVLALVGAVLVLARELRLAGEATGVTKLLPMVLYRPEVPAAYAALLTALAVRMLGLGFTPVLWLLGAGLIVHDQYRKVIVGPEGVLARYFDVKQLLVVPEVVALGGVALCVLTLFAPWATVSTLPVVADAPVPAGPPELHVIPAQRAADDVLYTAGSGITTLSGWDLSGSVVVELLLLSLLGLLALRPEVARPAWTRFASAGVVGVSLLWALLHIRLSPGPIIFVIGLGAVGVQAFRQLRESQLQAHAAAPVVAAYDDGLDETERMEDEPDPDAMGPDEEPEPDPDAMGPDDEEEDLKPRGR
ncbi:zinc ribbon domain-containing protein [Myxococcus sp. CA040A]|uniref:zinc ribbon domain-containing protein n=1 Tax=Myxococcus sp. CA040A TaxID=2741738 RepID=UPI00157B90A3|nr:zinc ribbon domain-containing protein [Myxococcus sp. CA040A]NTX07929.1 zinc ribbon domain-containing protein [Myxococcus sp. CA040A]